MPTVSKHIDGPIRGVFSTDVNMTIGHGTTKRKVQQNVLVFVEELPDGNISVQAINDNHVPSGETKLIDGETLLSEYIPEPEIYQKQVLPAIRGLNKFIARGERHRQNGESYSAEFEFKNALAIDTDNVRATFGLGLTYLDRNESGKADIIFRKLVRLEGAYLKKHKHMFNEFGIKLRRNQMYDQALEFYTQAEKLATEDDHLLFNIARSFYETGSFPNALRYLEKALSQNPQLHEALKLKIHIEKLQKNDSTKSELGKTGKTSNSNKNTKGDEETATGNTTNTDDQYILEI